MSKKKEKGGFILPVAIVLLVVAIFSVAIFVTYKYITPKIEKQKKVQFTACTQEAKICPDGSSVGRIGENCEFAQCPNEFSN